MINDVARDQDHTIYLRGVSYNILLVCLGKNFIYIKLLIWATHLIASTIVSAFLKINDCGCLLFIFSKIFYRISLIC